jgi:hypothetical protein
MTESDLAGGPRRLGCTTYQTSPAWFDGHLQITADGRPIDLRPGGLIHFAARLPHAVEAGP